MKQWMGLNMIEYLVKIKETEVYHIAVTATSEGAAIDLAYEKLDVRDRSRYWVNSEGEVEIM